MLFVFLTHPDFLESQSMPRFATMLTEGMIEKGYHVRILTAKPRFFKLPLPKALKKWMGYIDQYLVFPVELRRSIKKDRLDDTLYILTDNALGPWVPLVANRAHVVHCHDFLAQLSALNKFPENRTGWTGRRYQAFIRHGYNKGKNFISVSAKTQSDLHQFLGHTPATSEVVYNGFNQPFKVQDAKLCRQALEDYTGIDLLDGYILHIGGNQWYKNRLGVIKIYDAWRKQTKLSLPLLMIGQAPSDAIIKAYTSSDYKKNIYLLTGIKDELIRAAYSGASVLLFPSIAEGFGWPIIEAMASGCPVITTAVAPMTEVAGNAAYLVPIMPYDKKQQVSWVEEIAHVLNDVVNLSVEERDKLIENGLRNAERFNKITALNKIESIYLSIVENFKGKNGIL
jgi:glycosyltransferase involved in cell wall biosynthesis